jgi:hypothetical protein
VFQSWLVATRYDRGLGVVRGRRSLTSDEEFRETPFTGKVKPLRWILFSVVLVRSEGSVAESESARVSFHPFHASSPDIVVDFVQESMVTRNSGEFLGA